MVIVGHAAAAVAKDGHQVPGVSSQWSRPLPLQGCNYGKPWLGHDTEIPELRD